MMNAEAIKIQPTEYLRLLENWYLVRWKRRLELLNDTTNDLYLIRKVLDGRDN